MKKLLLTLLIFTTFASTSFAQGNMGHHSDNYSGVYSLNFNPADIVDSRWRFHMNIVSFNTTLSNNYLGIKRTALFADRDTAFNDPDFNDNYLVERLNGKKKGVFLNYDIGVLPSVMFNFGKKAENAIGINIRTRMFTNVDGVAENLARQSYYGLDIPELLNVGIQNKNFSLQSALWNEVGLTYGREVMNTGNHFLKAAGTVKLTQGLVSTYFYSDNLDVQFPSDSTVTVTNSDVRFGYSNVLGPVIDDAQNGFNFNQLNTKIGFGGDVGVVYEWRPNIDEYKYEMDGDPDFIDPRKTKYKLKAGIGLIDMGGIRFQREEFVLDEIVADGVDIDIEEVFQPALETFGETGLQDFADTLATIFTAQSSGKSNYSMSLPMRINAHVDYRIWKGFFANATASIAPAFKKNAEKTRGISEYSITPRYEHKWFAFYIPMSLNSHGNAHVGTGMRLGPLVVGTNDILPLAGKKTIYDANVYMSLSMPIGKKLRDRDKDHVSNKQDNCKKAKGTWPSLGCPDSDKDGITDDIDKCPDVAGVAKFDGCPDTDNDGIQDEEDECPEVAGIAKFKGCPDTDEDGVEDAEDACPEVAGLAEFKGCPDTDEDGVEDAKDDCPDVAGLAEFNGCADTDGDGIADPNDDCPDVVGIAANKGCPENVDKDRDKDGVLNAVDECPDTYGPASNKGCPEVAKEDVAVADIAFKNLEFETSRAIIKSSSFTSLENLVTILKTNPTYKLRVDGHTDNIGSEASNMTLSENRANAVKTYLTGKGIDASRIVIKAFGESKPIATNDTAAGRQENRRVELELF